MTPPSPPDDSTDKKTRIATPAPKSSPPVQTPAPASHSAPTVTPVPQAAPAAGTPAPYPGSVPPAPSPPPGNQSLGTNVPAAGMPAYVAPEDPLVGSTLLDRYYVEKKLGEGGMGAVYQAYHVTLEKKIALKVLHGEFSRKEDLVERFLLEAKAASRIRHENVIDISDFGTTPDGSVFFAMEFLQGRDLHDVLTRAKLAGEVIPWQRGRNIFLQVCAALAAAHKQGIIHRDLKPENIYLVEWAGQQDFVKLLDFGIAKVTEVSDDEGRKLTRTGMLFGTPEYMSPEQARGEKVDQRVDIYAMGCILFQLITGHVPFSADNFMGILSMHLTEEPPEVTPEQLAAVDAPPELAAVIARALAKDRDQRFSTIEELADAIRAIDQGVAPVPVQYEGSARVQRKRTQWTGSVQIHDDDAQPEVGGKGKPVGLLVAGGLVLAALVGGGVFLLGRGGSEGKPGPETEEVAEQPETPAADELAPVPDRINLVLGSKPEGAKIIEQSTGQLLGETPLEYTMPGSRESRRYRVTLDGYQDKLIELIPDQDVEFDITLKKRTAGTAAAEPEVVKVPQKPRVRRPVATKPVDKPTKPEVKPSDKPTDKPEVKPTDKPTKPEVKPSDKPTKPEVKPSDKPTKPEVKPSDKPTDKPGDQPPLGDVKIKDPFAN